MMELGKFNLEPLVTIVIYIQGNADGSGDFKIAVK